MSTTPSFVTETSSKLTPITTSTPADVKRAMTPFAPATKVKEVPMKGEQQTDLPEKDSSKKWGAPPDQGNITGQVHAANSITGGMGYIFFFANAPNV